MVFVRAVKTGFSGWWSANPFVFTYITVGSPIDDWWNVRFVVITYGKVSSNRTAVTNGC
jgi:hypothetical protein